MTMYPVSLEALLATRKKLFYFVKNNLSDNEKKFILSIKSGEPDYSLLPVKNIERLPAVQWKLFNIKKMDKRKHSEIFLKLQKILFL